jgi:hypothetical protein
LLRKIRAAAPAGGRLLLVDGWTDPTRQNLSFMPVYAGEFLLWGSQASICDEEVVHGWLRESGWRLVEGRPLSSLQILIVAEAAAPPG